MMKRPHLVMLLVVCTFGCGLLLAHNLALHRSVTISLPIATLENANYRIPPGTYTLGFFLLLLALLAYIMLRIYFRKSPFS